MERDTAADAPAAPAPSPEAAGRGGGAADLRVQAALCLAFFLAVINFAAPAPFFPEIARDLATTVPLLGQVTTAVTLLSAFLGLAVGPLAERYGARLVIAGGMVAAALNLLGTGLAPTYAVLLGLAVVGALGDAVLFGLPLGIAGSHFAGEARRRALARTSAALPAASVVAVPLLTATGGVVGWRAVFLGAGLATLAVTAIAVAWLPAASDRRDGSLRIGAPRADYRPLLGHRPLLALYAVTGLRGACWIGLLVYLGAFLAAEYGFGPREVGMAYMVGGAGVFAGSLAAGGRLGRFPPRPLIAATTVAQGLLFGAAYLQPLGAAIAVALLLPAAFAGAVAFVAVTTLLANETPIGTATTMVLNGSVFNLGTAVGVALGGALIAVGGYAALGIGLPLFALVAGWLALISSPADGRRDPAQWSDSAP